METPCQFSQNPGATKYSLYYIHTYLLFIYFGGGGEREWGGRRVILPSQPPKKKLKQKNRPKENGEGLLGTPNHPLTKTELFKKND